MAPPSWTVRRLAAAVGAVVAASVVLGEAEPWRPTVMTVRGMVASGHPLGSEAGLRILQAGGNAVDAAVAAWFIQGEVEPGMTGLGGDAFILIYLAKTGRVVFINGSGPAPMAATPEFYRVRGGMPGDGALSVEVPGAVGGILLALEKYGTKRRSDVLQPAIALAEEGFPISDGLAASLRASRRKLAQFPSTTKIWFRNGEPLGAGDIVRNPDLAATLRALAAGGRDAFYRGPVAKRSVEYLKAHGGIHELSDWANFQAHEDEPIKVTYKGIDVYECPPNSQGHVMLQALNILEGFDLKGMGHNSAAYLHHVTEALKLAFADRNRYVGDPRFVGPIPMQGLLSKEYAALRRKLIDPNRAIEGEPPPGDPTRLTSSAAAAWLPRLPLAPGGLGAFSGRAGGSIQLAQPMQPTSAPPREIASSAEAARPRPEADDGLHLTTYLAVVDRDRNMVSITSSLLSAFGSGMVVEGVGYFLNNRMEYFSLELGDPNVLAPGKRTRQTINPALALKDGKPYLVFGTPGADTQPQTQLQFFLNVVEFGMGVQEALEQPAVISTSFRASYYPQRVVGTLITPAALPQEVRDGLAARGHRLDVRDVRGVGSVKAILVHPRTNALMGGVSPTRDSYVVGW